MKSITILLFLFLGMWCNSQSPVLPGFRFVRMSDNKLITKKDVKPGQKALFIFFDVRCHHCQEAISFFNNNADKLANTGVYLLTMDNKAMAEAFLRTYGSKLVTVPNIMVLHDTYGEFIAGFKPRKYPAIFLYSEQSRLMSYSDDPREMPNMLELIKRKG